MNYLETMTTLDLIQQLYEAKKEERALAKQLNWDDFDAACDWVDAIEYELAKRASK